VTDDEPGVTRDRNYADTEWRGRAFTLVDTGGYVLQAQDHIEIVVRQQVEQAIEEADLVLFVMDVQTGPTDLDIQLARILQRQHVQCLLVVNKVDNEQRSYDVPMFYRLGLGDPMPVSAMSGRHAGDLLDAVAALLPEEPPKEEPTGIKVALLGRPNVGKSSFVNRLAKEERAVVDPRPGTTRDATDTVIHFNGKPIVLIDTAGLRRKSQKEMGIEFYSWLRTLRGLERCDVTLILIDAVEGPVEQDKRILARAMEFGKGAVLALNKWDLIERDTRTVEAFTEAIRSHMPFAPHIPLVFTSALTGRHIWKAMEAVHQVARERQRRVKTHELNHLLEQIDRQHPPPSPDGRPVKLFYVTQPLTAPPTFVFFSNRPDRIPTSYQKYLERRIREAFGFHGTPIRIIFRKK
jgi:GTP-binding protein